MIRRVVIVCFCIAAKTTALFAGQQTVEVFPSSLYDQYIIYETLVLFWIGIIGLIVIIKMKLKEIERIQRMCIDSNGHIQGSRKYSPCESGSGERVKLMIEEKTTTPPGGGREPR